MITKHVNHFSVSVWDVFISKILTTALISALCSSHQLFEGLKAYRGEDNQLRLFRPMLNMKRMSYSAKKACLPVRWM